MSRTMMLVAMSPAALLALTRVMFLVLAVWGVHPFWLPEPLNLAEAAALRDSGEVARLLADGNDPNATYRVRRGFVRDNSTDMTPIAAATAARRDEIVQLLIAGGARPQAPDAEGTP